MSFNITCSSCGAPSSPVAGICPYCKSVFANDEAEAAGGKSDSPGLDRINQDYEAGRIESALRLISVVEAQSPDDFTNREHALLYAKILLEAEGDSYKIKSVLTRALIANPQDPELNDFLDLVDARELLVPHGPDLGEQRLRALLRRSPTNPYALFILASHLYWEEERPDEAMTLLEQCVRSRPNFLRAWACLGTLYQKRGNSASAAFAFENCLKLENNTQMRQFFEAALKAC